MSKSHALLLACALIAPGSALALSCGDTVTADVTLTADLHCTTGWTALYVPTPGVTINLNGHTLSGTPGLAGISLHHAPGVTIKGAGTITGFWTGLNAFRSDMLNVQGIDFDQLGQGATVTLSQKSSFIANTFANMDWIGITIDEPVVAGGPVASGSHYIADNTFATSPNGIALCGMSTGGSMIENNAFSSLSDYGIHIRDNSDQNTIRSNVITDVGLGGIVLRASRKNAVETNLIEYGYNGIALYPEYSGCRHSNGEAVVSDNTIDGNVIRKHQTGIHFGFGSSPDTTVYKNWTRYNQFHNDAVGMVFRIDAASNGGTTNDYTGTPTPAIDEDGRNLY